MNAEEDQTDFAIARIASAIGEPARVRILYCLLDGRARTSTELAVIAGVTPSTASAHLNRLTSDRLIKVLVQGKHRYYSLDNTDVANALEGLSVVAGVSNDKFVPNTPARLREARTCYDHIAGRVGVALHNSFKKLRWLSGDGEYDLTPHGKKEFETLGIDVESIRLQRRRFAYPCLDWSERQPHLGGSLAAAILKMALKRKWMTRELEGRELTVTRIGKRELHGRFGFEL
ncbi:metalloregulator ArsR/SmtB family transcription factor [bacterium]|nr:metalloregulator ArsR/SmtB family transcription factor [bacterium]